MRLRTTILLLLCTLAMTHATAATAQTWTADNGNGTYTNPLFYDEFSDPDLIRVGDDFYLTGTTMHAMPGLPVLHSKDLVNWRFLSYACERLDLGLEYRLEGGRDIYGQGFWAPCFRYHKGTFYIFSNVNRQTTQVFRATNPAGPWTHTKMDVGLHDLSVLFDDDGKIYAVWGYRDLKLAQLRDDLSGIVPGTERQIFPRDSLMGEGVHFYRIDGKYYLTSAWYDGKMRMACARADRPEGPWEVNPAISMGEDFGLGGTNSLVSDRFRPPYKVNPPAPGSVGRRALHQGGLVTTPKGETWGFAMMDYNAVGRVTCLAPVTWKDGWPYFGLPGNLGRSPRVWVKPDTGSEATPSAPYERSDDFSGPKLKPVWQWNHAPENAKWSLTGRPGHLRLHALPAPDFWTARNTLTQRAVGPESAATTVLDARGMKPGDVAGLALLNLPYAWIGVRRGADGGLTVERYDQTTGETARASAPPSGNRVWLRARCDFLTEKATFHYSTDGSNFAPLGGEFAMVFQLKTFQGVRYALFGYHAGEGGEGGHADFESFTVDEPRPRGLTRPVPLGQTITLSSAAPGGAVLAAARHELVAVAPDDRRSTPEATGFTVVDRGRGRVALKCGDAYVSVLASGSAGQVLMTKGEPTERETFQWVETPYGDLALLSIASHRYLRIDPKGNVLSADSPGPQPPGREDGTLLTWKPTQGTP